ncbi:MAG: hypothetical protein HY558_01170 [Euryarchaeota archaeon]|nr:hypothetical protein [Euryarchaeota archaeon]
MTLFRPITDEDIRTNPHVKAVLRYYQRRAVRQKTLLEDYDFPQGIKSDHRLYLGPVDIERDAMELSARLPATDPGEARRLLAELVKQRYGLPGEWDYAEVLRLIPLFEVVRRVLEARGIGLE